METQKGYIEHAGKVVETGGKFEHVMALALDPRSGCKTGVIRCITSRDGDVAVSGYIDRSKLYTIEGSSPEAFFMRDELAIRRADEIVAELGEGQFDFLGLEDPDIFVDDRTGLVHLYFTLPLRNPTKGGITIHLGHAMGQDLASLEMTLPFLLDEGRGGAKELSVAPPSRSGVRYNLVESSIQEADFTYSTVRVAIADDMAKSWQFGETVFHPKEHGIAWIGGHASPGPLFPKEFIDIGEGKLLGVMNGREANRRVDGRIVYGMFSVGLFIYDYENAKIDWVSPEPFIRDSEARTITFASQFVPQGGGKGILYAHVDDSFVRAYTLDAAQMRALLP